MLRERVKRFTKSKRWKWARTRILRLDPPTTRIDNPTPPRNVETFEGERPSQLMILPRELLDMIIFYIEDDQSTLHSLALACHRLYEVTIPLLYKSFESRPGAPFRLDKLVRTLAESPSHQQYVKDVQLLDWEPGFVQRHANLWPREIKNVCAAIRESYPSSTPSLESIFARAKKLEPVAFVLLSLYLLPAVEKLTLSWSIDGWSENLRFAWLLASRRGPRFAHLKSLCINDGYNQPCALLASMMRLPSLRELQVSGNFMGCECRPDLRGPEGTIAWPEQPFKLLEKNVGVSNVSKLTVEYSARSRYPEAFVAALVAACKELKSFRFWPWDEYADRLDGPDWYKVLAPAKQSLREVIILDRRDLVLKGPLNSAAEEELRRFSNMLRGLPQG